jgi:hypothetical protein
MLNLLLWAGILTFSLASFNYTYMIGTINRVFLGLYKAVPESSVIAYSPQGQGTVPYFELGLLRSALSRYFTLNLPSYVPTYTLDIASYLKNETGVVATTTTPNQVSIHFHSNVGALGSYDKTALFTLVRSRYE